jgi:hypothetical protein
MPLKNIAAKSFGPLLGASGLELQLIISEAALCEIAPPAGPDRAEYSLCRLKMLARNVGRSGKKTWRDGGIRH